MARQDARPSRRLPEAALVCAIEPANARITHSKQTGENNLRLLMRTHPAGPPALASVGRGPRAADHRPMGIPHAVTTTGHSTTITTISKTCMRPAHRTSLHPNRLRLNATKRTPKKNSGGCGRGERGGVAPNVSCASSRAA